MKGIQSRSHQIRTCKHLDGHKDINYPAGIYLFKVNKRNRTRCEICSKLTIKIPERRPEGKKCSLKSVALAVINEKTLEKQVLNKFFGRIINFLNYI